MSTQFFKKNIGNFVIFTEGKLECYLKESTKFWCKAKLQKPTVFGMQHV